MEDLASIFVDRAKAEEKYGNALEKIGAQFQKLLAKQKYENGFLIH